MAERSAKREKLSKLPEQIQQVTPYYKRTFEEFVGICEKVVYEQIHQHGKTIRQAIQHIKQQHI
ncbi:MAG: hypothetical protein EBT86_11630 [Actinobacteria bacterium]|nr:hypothetical protein [Actinomycetota bacterium]